VKDKHENRHCAHPTSWALAFKKRLEHVKTNTKKEQLNSTAYSRDNVLIQQSEFGAVVAQE